MPKKTIATIAIQKIAMTPIEWKTNMGRSPLKAHIPSDAKTTPSGCTPEEFFMSARKTAAFAYDPIAESDWPRAVAPPDG